MLPRGCPRLDQTTVVPNLVSSSTPRARISILFQLRRRKMGSYFWEYYHFDYIFVILIRENSRFGSTPRILLSITDPTHNWLLAPAPPSVETPGTGCGQPSDIAILDLQRKVL